jgi:hypothetical protein
VTRGGRTMRVSYRMSPADVARLGEVAEAMGLNASETIRELVRSAHCEFCPQSNLSALRSAKPRAKAVPPRGLSANERAVWQRQNAKGAP